MALASGALITGPIVVAFVSLHDYRPLRNIELWYAVLILASFFLASAVVALATMAFILFCYRRRRRLR